MPDRQKLDRGDIRNQSCGSFQVHREQYFFLADAAKFDAVKLDVILFIYPAPIHLGHILFSLSIDASY